MLLWVTGNPSYHNQEFIFVLLRFKTTPRLMASLVVLTLLLSFHLTMAAINTDAWQRIFLSITLFTIFLFGSFIAVFISGFTGIAGCFPRLNC